MCVILLVWSIPVLAVVGFDNPAGILIWLAAVGVVTLIALAESALRQTKAQATK
jgi:hypothetical protein